MRLGYLRYPLEQEFADRVVDIFDVFTVFGERAQQIEPILNVLGHIVLLDYVEEVLAHQRQILELAQDQFLIERERNVSLLGRLVWPNQIFRQVPQLLNGRLAE